MPKASTVRHAPDKAKATPPVAVRQKVKAAVVALAKPAAKKGAKAKVKQPQARAAAPKPSPATRKAGAVKAKPAAKLAPPKKPSKPVRISQSTKPSKTAKVAMVKKPPARKAAPPAKAVAVKKATARRSAIRTAVPTPATRRIRNAVAPRKSAAVSPAPAPVAAAQQFTVSHLNQDDFKADGLRPYAQYRDLGIAIASSGRCQAHVIRFTPPCTDEVRKRHLHEAELQLVYVLQGWMKNEFVGHGVQMMSVGSCWLQPSGIEHTVLDYSADCEVLEIIVPADFKTKEAV